MKTIAIVFTIILVVLVNAEDSKSMQCQKNLMNQANNNQICALGDTACIQDLKSLGQCTKNCATQNNQDQVKTTSCVDQNCDVSNPIVQKFKKDFVGCLKSSSTIALISYLIAFLALLI
ncbi:hypothetical protein ABPG74_019183 [Tetrahymena malaccensis]